MGSGRTGLGNAYTISSVALPWGANRKAGKFCLRVGPLGAWHGAGLGIVLGAADGTTGPAGGAASRGASGGCGGPGAGQGEVADFQGKQDFAKKQRQ